MPPWNAPDGSGELVYLDHAASTPMRRGAIEAMLPHLDQEYANPNGSHRAARRARQALDEAREVVALALGCDAGEVVFTSGGTESDNAAIAGATERSSGVPLCAAIEHEAVLAAVERAGGRTVGVDTAGRVDLEQLDAALDAAVRAGTPASVVSVMAVNNEVGTRQDLAAVARLVRERSPGTLVHTDAVQAAPWLDLRRLAPHTDLLSLSAHKFGGPKGVGVLRIARSASARVAPLLVGGGQERERRSGTQNVAGVVAMAEALRLTDVEREEEVVRIGVLRDRLVDAITAEVPDVRETVPRAAKVAGSAHLCFHGVENEALLFLLDRAGVCASAASACAAGAMEPSHVLAAMGVERAWAGGSLRLTLGRTTTDADVDRAAAVVVAAVRHLRERVPA